MGDPGNTLAGRDEKDPDDRVNGRAPVEAHEPAAMQLEACVVEQASAGTAPEPADSTEWTPEVDPCATWSAPCSIPDTSRLMCAMAPTQSSLFAAAVVG